MFEGNLAEGEFEIGQIAVLIDKIKSVDEIIKQLIDEFNISSTYMSGIQF